MKKIQAVELSHFWHSVAYRLPCCNFQFQMIFFYFLISKKTGFMSSFQTLIISLCLKLFHFHNKCAFIQIFLSNVTCSGNEMPECGEV